MRWWKTLEEDLSPVGKEDWLKARLRHWIAALEGHSIVA
jgi:predicted alpha/beta hydrolase family esterase